MKQQRAYLLASLGLAVVLLVGAAAQVTRQEFEELSKKVAELEKMARYNKANLGLLKGHIERLEKRIGPTVSAPQRRPEANSTREPKRQTAQGQFQFAEIRNNMNRMTEAQWKKYARSLKGKTISWSGWVEDVNEKFFGGYELWVDMDPPNVAMSVQDVTFEIPDELALKLRKDQRVVFTGTIKSVMNVLGSCSVTLENGQVRR